MGFVRRLTGKTAAQAATTAADVQQTQALTSAADVGVAGTQAGALLDPFAQLGQTGVEQAGFLTDPQAQFEFLQGNPLFQAALENANRITQQSVASQGRLSAGDTALDLSKNFLVAAQPLISQQRQAIGGLIDLGRGTAQQQGGIIQSTAANVANLQTGGAAAQAAGIVGAETARGVGQQNILDIGAKIAGSFSDPLLKTNIKPIGFKNGHKIYSWTWNEIAKTLGLTGQSVGVMADEVKVISSSAVTMDRGFMKVDYNMIGVV